MGCWSTPLQWLCEVAGYWQELEHAVVYADPEHPKHAQWVTCLVSMLAMQELGCFQLSGQQSTQKWVTENKINLLPWPSQYSDLNPTENEWGDHKSCESEGSGEILYEENCL